MPYKIYYSRIHNFKYRTGDLVTKNYQKYIIWGIFEYRNRNFSVIDYRGDKMTAKFDIDCKISVSVPTGSTSFRGLGDGMFYFYSDLDLNYDMCEYKFFEISDDIP